MRSPMPFPADRPVRIGVVGAGYFAQFHCAAWQRLPEAALVALADPDTAKADAMAGQFGNPPVFPSLAAMLDKQRIDLLDIVTPPETHLDLMHCAADYGVPVVLQKPVAPTRDEARVIVDTAEQAGMPLIVHENFRFQPWYREIRRLLDDGVLGSLRTLTFRLRPGDGAGPDAYLDRQPYFRQMTRFLIQETGVHFVDVFRYLLGEPRALTASLRRSNPAIAGEDAGYVVFEFHGGLTALFDGNRLSDHAARDCRLTMGEMIIEGSDRVMRLDGDGGLWLRRPGEPEMRHAYRWSNTGFGGDCVHALCAQTLADLRDGRTPENTGRAYLRNLDIVDAIYDSSATGRRVSVEID